jgi:uncharacterized membrane protein
LVTAFWLRGVLYPPGLNIGWQSLAMVVNALTKAPNVSFVLLELLFAGGRRTFAKLALVILPAVFAAGVWTISSGADTATWRMVEITGRGPEAFDPVAKLFFMIGNPWHFPSSVLNSLHVKDIAELWRQTVGVHGLFDTVLLSWVYPVVSLLVLASFFSAPSPNPCASTHVAASAAVTVISYIAVVYLISYLVFTPSDIDRVWGVQGRYFVPILPLVAIVVGSLTGRGFDDRAGAALAATSALVSGCASVEAILRTDWLPSNATG